MKYITLFLFLLILKFNIAAAQEDWKHPKVYQRNVINNFLRPDGRPLFKPTDNPSVSRATFYEYFNDKVQATTHYYLKARDSDVDIVYRSVLKSNRFTQVFQVSSSPAPSYSDVVIRHNEKKEVIDNGLVFGLYRYGDFIELLYVKSVQGKLLIKI